MKYKTIIVIDIEPSNEAFIKQWGYDELLSLGFDVVLLNIFPWIYNDKLNGMKDRNVIHPIPNIKQNNISSRSALRETLDDIKGEKIVMYMATRSNAVLSVLKEMSIPYMTQFTMGGVHGYANTSFLDRAIKCVKRTIASPNAAIKKYRERKEGMNYEKNIYPPKYHVTMYSDDAKSFDDRTKIIINHSFDYDRFVRNSDLPKPDYIPDNDYVLLLANHNWRIHDNALDPHRTNKLIGRNEYKALITAFLNRLQEKIDKEIVISASPGKTKDEDIYERWRFILGGDTEQLVKYSSAVFGHYTGGFNFAVLHRKPISLISFRKMHEDYLFDTSMKIYSGALRTKINYVDTEEECELFVKNQMFEFKDVAYGEYIKKYIRTNELTKDDCRLYWERVYEFIENQKGPDIY